MKEWEKDVPLGIAAVLNEYAKSTTAKTFDGLEGADLSVVTPLSEIRSIARRYSKRYHVPIRINEKFMEDEHPGADAVHVYRKGKSVIYLHPILKYYPEKYVKGVIEHEIDHKGVEDKWEKVL